MCFILFLVAIALLSNLVDQDRTKYGAGFLAAMPNLNGSPASQRTPPAMLERLERTDAEFNGILRDVKNRGGWDDTFVDALCEPPETFTFGGVFAHIMTFNAHRRLTALDSLRQLGVAVEGFGDPIEYEQCVAPWSGEPAAKE